MKLTQVRTLNNPGSDVQSPGAPRGRWATNAISPGPLAEEGPHKK